jgi:capsular polysaccharide biosynthesis protein
MEKKLTCQGKINRYLTFLKRNWQMILIQAVVYGLVGLVIYMFIAYPVLCIGISFLKW